MCKRFLLAALNAKYIHSNPGVYSLRAFARERLPEAEIEIAEYTINHQTDRVLQDIYRKKPDFVGFSCYIWNISQILSLARDLSQVLPETEIWLGGPEVSYDAGETLSKEPEIRGVMRGEGELTFTRLAEAYLRAEGPGEEDGEAGTALGTGKGLDTLLSRIPGITYRDGRGEICENGPQGLLSMDEIPFYYQDMTGFENRIVYYESSRGCPFSCSYCLSSLDKSVRFRSLSLVKRELDFFLERKVPQVKFVDRTFNCKREHTLGIWKHILEHDNGVTNFHFEVSADLLDQEELELIGQMRPGLIQLEIGVQSTNPDTIREIRRKMDLPALKRAVERVRVFRNTHQHLDLIAGLPWEDMESFLKSFDDVYRMAPDQLQLGFLKVLKGSYMASRKEEYGLRHRMSPPYETLATRWLSYGDMIRLKGMEEMVEVYYNSGQFESSIRLLEQEYGRPSELFLDLAAYYEERGLTDLSHSRMARYEILYDFIKSRTEAGEDITGNRTGAREKTGGTGKTPKNPGRLSAFRDRLLRDLYARENVKSRPSFAMDQSPFKAQIREFFQREERERRWLPGYAGYDSRQLASVAHLEAMEDGSFLLFDYGNRDPLTKNARILRFFYEETGNEGRIVSGQEKSEKNGSKKDQGTYGKERD